MKRLQKNTLFSHSLLIGLTRDTAALGLTVIWVCGGSQEVCQKRGTFAFWSMVRSLLAGVQKTIVITFKFQLQENVSLLDTLHISPTIFPKNENAL